MHVVRWFELSSDDAGEPETFSIFWWAAGIRKVSPVDFTLMRVYTSKGETGTKPRSSKAIYYEKLAMLYCSYLLVTTYCSRTSNQPQE